MEKKNKNNLKKLQKKLYQRGFKQKADNIRPVFYAKTAAVAKKWKKIETKNLKETAKNSFENYTLFRNIFIASMFFFVIALGVTAYIFLAGSNIVSSNNVDIKIIGPVSVSGGDELSLEVIVTNNNNTTLKLSDLSVKYPSGVYDSEDPSKQLQRFRKLLGSIQPGQTVTEIVRSSVYGEEGSEKKIDVSVEYRIEGSNAIFIKSEPYKVIVSSSPINLVLNSAEGVSAEQETKLELVVSSNSDDIIKDVSAVIDYPFGFEPTSYSVPPSFGNNTWEIGDIDPSSEIKVEISGIMHGQEGDEKNFRARVGKHDQNNVNEIVTVYSSSVAKSTVKETFISVGLSLDNDIKEEYSFENGKILNGVLSWKNNLPIKVEDVSIEMFIDGEILDPSSVSSNEGVYDSASNKIVWDKRSFPQLESVEPGEAGRLNFRFGSKKILSSGTHISNPQIDLSVSVHGRTQTEETAQKSLESFFKRIVRFNSDLQLSARAVYSDGPFVNSGPMPPRVNEQTSYTVMWTVVNSSNDISRAQIKTTLPSYVSWLGNVSPAGEGSKVSFDEFTGELVWDIGNISAGAGVSLPAKEVAFQVSVVPSVSHADSILKIVDEAVLRGEDDFTGETVVFSRPELTTYISTDSGFSGEWSRVIK